MEKVKVSKEVAEATENVMGMLLTPARARELMFNNRKVEETLQEKWAKIIGGYKMLAASDDLREKCYGSEQLILLKKLKADGLIDLPGLD